VDFNPPPNYTAPAFPSLYIPQNALTDGRFLYYTIDVWRFTVWWTLTLYTAFHLAASGYAAAVQPRNWKLMWIVILFYLIIGGVMAVFAGSAVGLM